MMKDEKNICNETLLDYGIRSEEKNVYHYKQYHYDNLQDAIDYARIDKKREDKSVTLKKTDIKHISG